MTPITDPEAVLRLRGGSTIEWILGGLDPDVTYTAIALRVWNRSGADPGALATIRTLDASETMDLPYCLSLWAGEPCSSAAVLPHVFMGPLAENDAQAEILLTNRDPKPQSCDVAVLFHQGVSEGPEILFDGQAVEENLLHMTIPRGVLNPDPHCGLSGTGGRGGFGVRPGTLLPQFASGPGPLSGGRPTEWRDR